MKWSLVKTFFFFFTCMVLIFYSYLKQLARFIIKNPFFLYKYGHAKNAVNKFNLIIIPPDGILLYMLYHNLSCTFHKHMDFKISCVITHVNIGYFSKDNNALYTYVLRTFDIFSVHCTYVSLKIKVIVVILLRARISKLRVLRFKSLIFNRTNESILQVHVYILKDVCEKEFRHAF